MEQLIDIFRFMTVGLLMICFVKILQSPTKRSQAWPAALFCFGIFCYLLVDWGGVPRNILTLTLLAPAFGAPFFFWLLNKSLFDDHFRVRPWMVWVLLLFLGIHYLMFFIHINDLFHLSDSTQTVLMMMRHGSALVFVGLAIMEASRDREADLVLSRMKFRSTIMFLAAGLIGATILGEIAFPKDNAPLWLDLLQKMVIFGLTFFFAFRRLDFRPGFFSEHPVLETEPPQPEVDRVLVKQILDLIDGEKYYRTEGLTIRRLSEKMEVKEYKLRQTINQQMGFRNFNDFLNSYRIAEACDLLQDPEKADRTILEIAYQMGFNSLAPFNKAFKAQTGMTPTEWRKSKKG